MGRFESVEPAQLATDEVWAARSTPLRRPFRAVARAITKAVSVLRHCPWALAQRAGHVAGQLVVFLEGVLTLGNCAHDEPLDQVVVHRVVEAIDRLGLEAALDRVEVSYAAGRHAWEPRTVVHTPTVTATPRQIAKDVDLASTWLSRAIDQADDDHDTLDPTPPRRNNTELLIVDEADRLKMLALEQLRDHFDRTGTGLILIGMPGIERRLARHPQLYSRVGFAHEYRTLSSDELAFVLEHHYQRLGLTLSADDFTDAEAIAAVARITGGNFRLVHRLFAQISRVLDINNLSTITNEVVETARQNLVIWLP